MSKVFIALQTNEDSRPIVEAILADNPLAEADYQPAMVKVSAEDTLVIKRETIEELIGRDYDLQEIQVNMITMSGYLDEDEDEFRLSWKN
ncbi:MmoB/DmpM family protein [Rhodocyclus purpureus]|uniref:MmoB/DmpM family protein n=1 Tax=Rhodocyclus purpureus TaxID=1067 RepID=UPI001913D652|nr:MmoB/DmpM family protein [Rhodocyclus purpureus]MBK5914835.1 monooxygenase [Rhodocyclus purpureus]